ncbi:MAG: hypothetical protein IPF40_02710 [Actinomycetales bacterium]|uniref:Uncharacterized protein n=1 Tax=Candidatus Phosphoribacter hodrii TaxID=2953743 RepID=A0A934X2W3_9MICO|nr:hypothetical protein [Candidatus Phosphoribacter hodrii]
MIFSPLAIFKASASCASPAAAGSQKKIWSIDLSVRYLPAMEGMLVPDDTGVGGSVGLLHCPGDARDVRRG